MNYKTNNLLCVAVLLIGCLALVTACDSGSSDADKGTKTAAVQDDFVLTGDAAAGEALYTRNCVACHGAEGNGAGPAGKALTPPPSDFTAGGIPAGQIYKAVKGGGMAVGKSATMPPFASMSEEDLQNVVAYVMAFSK